MLHTHDDHYIANPNNAHIDTTEFENELNVLYGNGVDEDWRCTQFYPQVYSLIQAKFSNSPDEPNDAQLICRYLSPAKFLLFIAKMEVFFCKASEFEDSWDSEIPEDYNRCVQRFLMNKNVMPDTWDKHTHQMKSRWLVSCWTEITDHHDDHLLWHKYAEGNYGVGITMRYGVLKDLFQKALKNDKNIEGLLAGHVSYKPPLKIAPFNKRPIFRNEKEIRFVSRTNDLNFKRIKISKLKSQIGLRLSPESPLPHRDAVRAVWLRFGGKDRIHVGGE